MTIQSTFTTKIPDFSIFTANFNIFLHQLGACAFFRGFYEARTSQLKSYSKNSEFYRASNIAAYKTAEKSDELSEMPLIFTEK